MVVNQKTAAIVITLAALSILVGIWWFQPDRRLERSWATLIRMTEARRAAGVGGLMADDYADRWGYSKTTLVEDARLAFFHFDQLEVTTRNVVITRVGQSATITAEILLNAAGTPRADEARATVNALFSPFTFEWRRDAGFPWTWRLTRIDHPQFRPDRFRGQRAIP